MRVIPLLLYKDHDSFKGVNYKNHVYLGDILNQIRILNDYKVDELTIINIEKNFNERKNLNLIKTLSLESNFAISVGGGIDNFEYIKKIFDNGADKVILNSAIYNDLKLIDKVSSMYGSQAISIKLDVIKNGDDFIIYNNKKKKTLDTLITELNKLNFSELIISDVDRDGTKIGLNIKLLNYVKNISNKLNLFSGGIKNFSEIKKLSQDEKISGLIVGTFFSLYGNLNAPLIHYLNDYQKKQISKN